MPVYPWLKPLLFALPPEAAHRAMAALAGPVGRNAGLRALLRAEFFYEHEALHTRLWGRALPNPVGLAAGFDKDGHLLEALSALGFGLLEAGTVTPRPQPGNPRPRLFRLPTDHALINRMGFNNGGAEALATRLGAVRKRLPGALLGVNLGKNRDTPLESAVEDYLAAMAPVYGLADYLVVNVSSPNTPGLRGLQSRAHLSAMLGRLHEARLARTAQGAPRVPLLVKVAPDLDEAGLSDVVQAALEQQCDGLIATNTTLGREGASHPLTTEGGGLSGRPLHGRAVAVVAALYRLSDGRLPIIGVGGIFGPDDAYAFIRAGASAVQVYTGLVYRGPGLVRAIKRGLVRLLERDGLPTIGAAVGLDAPGGPAPGGPDRGGPDQGGPAQGANPEPQ